MYVCMYVCIYIYIYIYIYKMFIYIYIYIINVYIIYRKIPLIRPGRIYGQRTNLMGLYSGGLYPRGLIFGRKKTSIWNLLNLLFFLFSSIKHVFRHFSRRARCKICSKLTIKIPEYVKLMIKLKIKTPLTSFWPLYC